MSKAPVKKKELRTQPLEMVTVYENGIPLPEPYLEFAAAYGIHTWVFACVRAIVEALSSIELLAYSHNKAGEWERQERDEFEALLRAPNPYMTGLNLRQMIYSSLALTGNAYVALEKMGGQKVRELWPLPVDAIKPVSSKDKFISKYVYTVNGQDIPFEADEIIHFRTPNPSSLHYGMGPVAPLKNAIIADLNAANWNKVMLANGGKLDGILESDQQLEEPTKRRIISGWKKMYAGSKNAGSTAVLDFGLKYKALTSNVKDMDFVNLRKQLRDEILAAFNVPPSVVGVLELANYSNMEVQQKAFWVNTLIPILRNVEATTTLRAQQLFGSKDTVYQGDLSNVEALRANEKDRAQTAQTYVDVGVPLNEVIDKLDLPFDQVEGGDVSRPRTTAPFAGGASAPAAQEPPAPPAKGVKALASKDVDLAEEKRVVSWKRFDARISKREDAFQGAMSAFFKGQQRRVLKALDANASRFTQGKALSFSMKLKVLDETVRVIFDIDAGRHISGAYFDFAVTTAQAIKPGFNFNLQDPVALAWVEAKKIKLAQEANEFTMEQISDAVVDGIEQAVAGGFSESETIQQIADRIDEVYKFAVEGRAERIARTEVISAANAGALDGMDKTGVEKKSWLSSRDGNVRDSHRALEDAGPVGIREPFVFPVTGEKLQFPGDPSAPADEIVNCRCTVLAE
jgi:HK97 family phage portal protein